MAKKDGVPAILKRYMELDNIAVELDSQTLVDMASYVVENVHTDQDSRYQWLRQYHEAMKIAKQISSGKNTPWQGAADVKYPLILSACLQYNARTFPEVIKGNTVVTVTDMNLDITEVEEDRNDRIASHMSWQLLEDVDNWITDTDKLLMVLPLAGVVYRKTRFNSIDKKPDIELCLPTDIVINNDVASLEKAERITHILHMSDNDLLENMRAGLFLEMPLEELSQEDNVTNEGTTDSSDLESETDDPELHTVYEMHMYYDLDNDGYEEPYIVTVHKDTEKVLRIVARYNKDSFVYASKNNRFVKIKPKQYFTDYHFVPSPDGGFHSMGFGKYLYPINETINTIINQLLDAGTLQNTGGGFIAKSLRIKKEDLSFKIGEYKAINIPTGSNLSQNIFPMPASGPSPVLLQLLELLIKSAEELASVSDIMQGQSPAAGTTATTVISVIEQGSKVYSSMLNRLYNSLKKEYEKLFEINKEYLDVEETFTNGKQAMRISLEDYRSSNVKVFPVADPAISSDAQRMAIAQNLMQIIQDPGIDKEEVLERFLKALKIPHPEKVLIKPDPNAPPPIQEQLAEAELKLKHVQTADIIMKRDLEAIKLEIDEIRLKKEEKEMQIDAAYKGAMVTESKVDAMTKMAQTDVLVGESMVNQAQKQVDMMQTNIHPDLTQSTQEQLTNLEAVLGSQTGAMAGRGNLGNPDPSTASTGPSQGPNLAQSADKDVEEPTGEEETAKSPSEMPQEQS